MHSMSPQSHRSFSTSGPRRFDLLTPFDSALLPRANSSGENSRNHYQKGASVSSFLSYSCALFHSPYPVTPFLCHSYENTRGVPQLFPFWFTQSGLSEGNARLIANYNLQPLLNHTLSVPPPIIPLSTHFCAYPRGVGGELVSLTKCLSFSV